MSHDIPGTLMPSHSLMERVCVCGHKTLVHYYRSWPGGYRWGCLMCEKDEHMQNSIQGQETEKK